MPACCGQHQGGLGPFAQQLVMFSLAPIVTDLASDMISGLLPGLSGGQRGSGKFDLPGNWHMIGLPNHLPPSTYLQVLQPRQKGRGLSKKRKKGRHPVQKGGIGPLALAGMADAAPTTTSWSAAALKQKRILKEVTRVCLFSSLQTMAPPLNAWRTQAIKLNPNYRVSLAASRQANQGFDGPVKASSSKFHQLRCASKFSN